MKKTKTEIKHKRTITIKGKVVYIYLYGDFSHNTILVLLNEETGKLHEVKTHIEKSMAKTILLNKLIEITKNKSDLRKVEIENIKIIQESIRRNKTMNNLDGETQLKTVKLLKQNGYSENAIRNILDVYYI